MVHRCSCTNMALVVSPTVFSPDAVILALVKSSWCKATHYPILVIMQDFEKAGTLRDREMELKAQISAITGAAKEGEAAEAESSAEGGGPLVTEADIANIVAQWTGIPVEKVRALCL